MKNPQQKASSNRKRGDPLTLLAAVSPHLNQAFSVHFLEGPPFC
jgi:hypothetical protein